MSHSKYKLDRLRSYLKIDDAISDSELINKLSNEYLLIGDTRSIVSQAYVKLDIGSKFDHAKQDYKKKLRLKSKIKSKKIEPFSAKDQRWRNLRNKVFRIYGRVCMSCGSTKNIQVDHIKPKSIYPELSYDFDNLQPLCAQCNSKKSNIDMTDYRAVNEQDDYDSMLIANCPF